MKFKLWLKTNKYFLTLAILCLGYFIDFYDLTIMSASYHELIPQQFNISSAILIQKTYLMISNYQTLGVIVGSVIFGALGDRIGRAITIKYSIILYSFATIFAIFTHHLSVFILLRFVAYVGLACEFATSTVLILELFPIKTATWNSAILYSFGVLGGIAAAEISFLSWQIMFWCGGIAGLIIFLLRKFINESLVYKEARQNSSLKNFGSFRVLLQNKRYLTSLLRYFLMILPFYAVISLMFMYPNYIVSGNKVGYTIKLMLLGFFIGNMISCVLSGFVNNLFANYKCFLIFMLGLFLVLLTNFMYVSEDYLILYSVGVGLIGGGYPITWAQQLAKDFPLTIRSTASNFLVALGRFSQIIFNLIISNFLVNKNAFILCNNLIVLSVVVLTGFSIFFTKNSYARYISTSFKNLI